MALYNPHSIFHLARFLYVGPETFGPCYVLHIQRVTGSSLSAVHGYTEWSFVQFISVPQENVGMYTSTGLSRLLSILTLVRRKFHIFR